MGARATLRYELFTDRGAFCERTGMLRDWSELRRLGFESDSLTCSFWPSHANRLLEFVRANPAFHIVTFTSPGRYVNQYVEGPKALYHLADGDPDPYLICNPFIAPNWHLAYEDMVSNILTMLNDVKNRGQG